MAVGGDPGFGFTVWAHGRPSYSLSVEYKERERENGGARGLGKRGMDSTRGVTGSTERETSVCVTYGPLNFLCTPPSS